MDEPNKVPDDTLVFRNPPTKKESIEVKIEEEEEKNLYEKKEKDCFPFKEGKGLKETLENLGLIVDTNDKKIHLSKFKEKIFDIKVLIKAPNGKLKKMKKRRKFKPDNIRKKIKSRFHKDLKKRLNDILKINNSKKLFDLFPQSFITNITIKQNQKALSTTFGKLIEQDCLDSENKKEPNIVKFNKNKDVINYLMVNDDIRKKTEFDKIINMTYEELLKAYFSSAEFEDSLVELYKKNKQEKIDYFEDYIYRAKSYISFFKKNKNISIEEK